MGYNTKFKLKADKQEDAIEAYFHEALDGTYMSRFYYYEGEGEWESEDAWTWYNHEDDMIGLSHKFPEVLFTLDGEGEDNRDIWRSYFKNGKTYTWSLEV